MTTFFKKGNTYWARRVSSGYYFLLGLVFSEKTIPDNEIEVIELHPKGSNSSIVKIPKEELLRQVKNGLQKFNEAMQTNYSVSQVSYPPSEESSSLPIIYDSLTRKIVRRYHQQEDFPDYSEKNDTKEDDSS